MSMRFEIEMLAHWFPHGDSVNAEAVSDGAAWQHFIPDSIRCCTGGWRDQGTMHKSENSYELRHIVTSSHRFGALQS